MNLVLSENVHRLMSQRPGQQLLTDVQWSEVGEALELSSRERQVCRLLFEGHTRQEIAEGIEIKNRTVRHHMEKLHAKLKVNNRVGVVLRIIQVRDQLETDAPPAT